MRMSLFRSSLTIAAVVALNSTAEQVRFDQPRHGGYRLDACRSWGAGCGQDAADAFCATQGFQKAIGFEIDRGIGAVTPTMTIGDRQICNQARCDGFKWITCERSGQPAPGRRGAPPPGQPAPPPISKLPPVVLDPSKKPPATPPPAPTPSTPPAPAPESPRTPAPATPNPAILAERLDPEEFVVIVPNKPTGILGRFGSKGPSGELVEKRTIALQTNGDLVQTASGDVDGDRQAELILLETPDPQKPGEALLRFLKLTDAGSFSEIGRQKLFLDAFPLLSEGRLLRERPHEALVCVSGHLCQIAQWDPTAPSGSIRVIGIEQWIPSGVVFLLDATGDGVQDLLDYSEDGRLDLVTVKVERKDGVGIVAVGQKQTLGMFGPGQRFAVGDFTGDGRTDLLVHDAKSSTVSMIQFDGAGGIRSKTVIANNWPATYTWTRGYDYDGDGRDDLLVNDPGRLVAVVRFTAAGGLHEFLRASDRTDAENLRFPGYFMSNGRASYLTHGRAAQVLNHRWFDVVAGEIIPNDDNLRNVVLPMPSGSLVVVGNFRRDR